MVIDHQTHWCPPAYIEAMRGRTRYPRLDTHEDGFYILEMGDGDRWVLPLLDFDQYRASMDEYGVDVMVCSVIPAGQLTGMERTEALEAAELLNEETAAMQRAHPDRFVGLASLPLNDAETAIQALDRAIVELDLRGVSLVSSLDGKPIVSEELLPLYRRIEELDVPIYLHPTTRSIVYPRTSPAIELGIGWLFDTSTAALEFVATGTLDECPNLIIVHPHLGGVIPFAAGRLGTTFKVRRHIHDLQAEIEQERPLVEYLRSNFYVDSASPTPGALQLAVNTYGIDRILFGSDHPFRSSTPRSGPINYVRNELSEADADAVFSRSPSNLRLPVAT